MVLDPREAGLLASALAGWISLTASFLLLLVAALVLAANPRKPANVAFAFFLFLVAGNAIPDGLSKLLGTTVLRAGPVDLPVGVGSVLDRIGLAFLIVDPGVLLYFAAIFPTRSRLARRRGFWCGIVGLWTVLVAVLLLAPNELSVFPRSTLAARALVFYMAACYLAAYGFLLARLAREASPLLAAQEQLLAGALGIALLYRLGSLPTEVGLARPDPVPHVLVLVAIPWAVFGLAIAWSLTRATPANRAVVTAAHRITATGLIGLSALTIAPLAAAWFATTPDLEQNGVYVLVRNVSVSSLFFLRWVAFTAIGGYAVLRHQVFDLDARVRRAGALAIASIAAVALVALAWVSADAIDPVVERLGPARVALLIAALVAAPFVARGVRARLALGEPRSDADDGARRVEMYRAGIESALRNGEVPATAEGELRRLRRALRISDDQHRVLLDVVRLERRGPAPAHGGTPRAGSRLAARYELGDVIGEGSNGRCRVARDLLLGRSVVVKETASLDAGRGTLREARAAGHLNHPNIVTVHDVIEAPGVSYLVMEHVEGGSLRDRLAHGRVLRGDAVRILSEVLAGLEAAHDRGIVHGDLKPENILLTRETRAKLADFGSAYASTLLMTMASLPSRAGPATLLYMAPEQVEGASATTATDLYAVAVIAHELLLGRHYVDVRGKGDLEIREAIARTQPKLDGEALPVGLAGWLARGLEKAAKRRWPNAQAMRAGLLASAPD